MHVYDYVIFKRQGCETLSSCLSYIKTFGAWFVADRPFFRGALRCVRGGLHHSCISAFVVHAFVQYWLAAGLCVIGFLCLILSQ